MIKLEYVDGLKFDYNIKNLYLDVRQNKITVLNDKIKELFDIEYDELDNLKIYDDIEIRNSIGQGIFAGIAGGIAFGGIGCILGSFFGSLKTKNIFYIEINVKGINGNGTLTLKGDKNLIKRAYDNIMLNYNN